MLGLFRLAGLALSVAAVGSLAVPIEAAEARSRKKSSSKASKRSGSRAAAYSGGSFRSCAQARAAGAAPVRSGDAGYSRRIDRDGDGVACER
ncbi:MAG TPA: excalibur calcium-binding domain-containing protein [Allosphingosinicella sp.]|jgi:hypothetical protein